MQKVKEREQNALLTPQPTPLYQAYRRCSGAISLAMRESGTPSCWRRATKREGRGKPPVLLKLMTGGGSIQEAVVQLAALYTRCCTSTRIAIVTSFLKRLRIRSKPVRLYLTTIFKVSREQLTLKLGSMSVNSRVSPVNK